jgi:hypothetical protein
MATKDGIFAEPISGVNSVTPVLRFRFEVDGAAVGEPISILIPRVLSMRIAKMHALETIVRELKKGAELTVALKAIGCK